MNEEMAMKVYEQLSHLHPNTNSSSWPTIGVEYTSVPGSDNVHYSISRFTVFIKTVIRYEEPHSDTLSHCSGRYVDTWNRYILSLQ